MKRNLEYFLNNDFDSYEECLDFYLTNICDNLLRTNPEAITDVKNKLYDGISEYAKNYSAIYAKQYQFYTRNELNNKDLWISTYIPKDRVTTQNTSGSTTGEPFSYYNDRKNFVNVQRNAEFDLILKEYDLFEKPLKILNLFKHPYNPKPTDFFLETHNHSNHPFHCYMGKETNTFFVNWDEYIENSEKWHNQFLEFLSHHYFDIVLCSGPVINILTRHIKKNNFVHKFAYLLSHTTEFPRIGDFEYLKNNGNTDYYCDHMRCWDGGASFFTCKFGTYHLNDNLSWVHQGPDKKMISTDYFNIVAPFVNYWNGDLCEIKDEYQLCACGRWYRPFKMLQNRPFALKGPTKLTEIREKIRELEFKSDIDQVQFENLTANVYLKNRLDENCINKLKEILNDYEVKIYE